MERVIIEKDVERLLSSYSCEAESLSLGLVDLLGGSSGIGIMGGETIRR